MELPVGNIVTAVATVISVVIANHLSSRQSGKARVWDFKRQAYGVILSELASVERICDAADSYMEEDVHRYFESKTRDIHNEQISAHTKTMRQRFSDDYLILSDPFIALFETFMSELDAIPPDANYPEEDELFSKAVRKHRPLLLAQARRETTTRRIARG